MMANNDLLEVDRKFAALRQRPALSLLELLAALAILAVLAGYIIPRVVSHLDDARRNACHANRGNIELQVQLWRRNTGSFPASSLSDIGSDSAYFPDGLPVCPVDGTAYTIDTTTGSVIGHNH
jgi:prepilin-type N-terminal cleavage/methylation domain-containing protein